MIIRINLHRQLEQLLLSQEVNQCAAPIGVDVFNFSHFFAAHMFQKFFDGAAIYAVYVWDQCLTRLLHTVNLRAGRSNYLNRTVDDRVNA